MSLTITIPDEFADVLGASAEERERRAREALALDLYREGKISLRRMGELAGVGGDYWAAENFRVLHKAPLNYSVEDLEADRQAAERLCKKSAVQEEHSHLGCAASGHPARSRWAGRQDACRPHGLGSPCSVAVRTFYTVSERFPGS